MTNAIALVGAHSDPIIQGLARNLANKHEALYLIEPDSLGKSIDINHQGFIFKQDGSFLSHKSIKAVFNRWVELSPRSMHQKKIFTWLLTLLDHIYPHVMNAPQHQLSNFSKPLQLQMLAQLNTPFSTPSSIICANTRPPTQPLLYKSISSIRSQALPWPGHTTQAPMLYQSIVKGHNIRVHTVGKQVIATKVYTDTLDYRYGSNNALERIELPPLIQEGCRTINLALHLKISGIDLINLGKTWTILEANTAPGYDYFDRHMPGNPVEEAVSDWLLTQAHA